MDVENNPDGVKPEATSRQKDAPTTPKDVFVISPIGELGSDIHRKAAYALKFIFKRALPEPEWRVHRADEGKVSDSIGQYVIRSIVEAKLVIADLTGHNPNVFYELAVAHAFKKPVVHLITKGERLPFDIFDQRTIHYDITDLESVECAVREVEDYARAVLAGADGMVNPLSTYDALASIRKGDGAPLADVLEQIMARISGLEGAVTNLTRIRPTHNFHPMPFDEQGVQIIRATKFIKDDEGRMRIFGTPDERDRDEHETTSG